MSDIKLFKTSLTQVAELAGVAVALEKSLQTLFEKNLEALLGDAAANPCTLKRRKTS